MTVFFISIFFRESNERLFRVLRAGELRETQSQKIRVGDVVHLRDGELIPCDLVIDAQFEFEFNVFVGKYRRWCCPPATSRTAATS